MKLTLRQKLSFYTHLWKALTRTYHTQLTATFRPYLRNDGVVFDVGAHAGHFTKLYSSLVPDGCVYSLKPSAYSRRILQTMIGIKGLDNVFMVPCGLSDSARAELLHTPIKDRGSLGYGLAFVGDTAGSPRQLVSTSVRLATIDGIVEALGIERLDFLKADIEGAELAMLRGAWETLQQYLPTLYLEIDDGALARNGDSGAELLSYLAGLGYTEVLEVDETTGEHRPASLPDDTRIHGNFLFPSPVRGR